MYPPWCVVVYTLIDFDIIERLCNLGKTALDAEMEYLYQAMDRDYQNLESEDEEGDYLAHVNDEYIEVSETLPCLHWYAQFLVSYSFFEKALNNLSYSFQKHKKFTLSLKDIDGQGIARAKTYLSKVCGIETPFTLPEWQMAKLYSEIRNAVAHRSGFVDYVPHDPRSLCFRLQNKGVELKQETFGQDDAQIILTGEFILESLKVYRVILSEIGGLGRDFITPKHGLPGRSNTDPV